MKIITTISLLILCLLLPTTLLIGGWNLLAPAAWCWLPRGLAAAIGAVASLALVTYACSQATAQEARKRPSSALAANPPQKD